MFLMKVPIFQKWQKTSLYVSEALHKIDIEFTEKGVEAATVTIFVMTESAYIPRLAQSVNIIIDKPFRFIIIDKMAKNIWFTDSVYESNSWKDDTKKLINQIMDLKFLKMKSFLKHKNNS